MSHNLDIWWFQAKQNVDCEPKHVPNERIIEENQEQVDNGSHGECSEWTQEDMD